jgi:hypothetical protein
MLMRLQSAFGFKITIWKGRDGCNQRRIKVIVSQLLREIPL